MFVAIKGKVRISEKDLKDHIGSIFRFDNIGVLLGAGASVSAGGKTMNETWKHFRKNFPNDHKWLYEEKYCKNKSKTPDIEKVLSDINASINHLSRSKIGKSNLAKVKIVKQSICKSLMEAAILDRSIWDSSNKSKFLDSALESHRDMIKALTSSRESGQSFPWVFTTNYDLAIEWAAECIDVNIINGFSGITKREFMPHVFRLGNTSRFDGMENQGIYLVKLHGSLIWRYDDNNKICEIQGSEGLRKIDKFLNGKSKSMPFVILPSSEKHRETMADFSSKFIKKFSDFLSNSEDVSLIISGYGFRDSHLDIIIKENILGNKKLKVVIYFPDFKDINEISNLPEGLSEIIRIMPENVVVVGGQYFRNFVSHIPVGRDT